MAKSIIAKNVNAQAQTNSGRVTYSISAGNETLVTDSDFSFDEPFVDTYGNTGTRTFKMIPRTIVKVINAGASAATIDGKSYNAGATVDFSQTGGMPLAAAGTCAITFATVATGNCVIEFRS